MSFVYFPFDEHIEKLNSDDPNEFWKRIKLLGPKGKKDKRETKCLSLLLNQIKNKQECGRTSMTEDFRRGMQQSSRKLTRGRLDAGSRIDGMQTEGISKTTSSRKRVPDRLANRREAHREKRRRAIKR